MPCLQRVERRRLLDDFFKTALCGRMRDDVVQSPDVGASGSWSIPKSASEPLSLGFAHHNDKDVVLRETSDQDILLDCSQFPVLDLESSIQKRIPIHRADPSAGDSLLEIVFDR